MIEIMVYMSVTALLLILIITLIINIFGANRNIRAITLLDQNERFIANYIINKMHSVNYIEPIVGPPTDVYFYQLPDVRWNITIENNDLVMREVLDEGSGFPAQSSGDPIILNSETVDINSLVITPLDDNQGNENQGVVVEMSITTTIPGNSLSRITRQFNFFASIR